ncbi:MAG: 30S ribosomal protein S12 methylthiotransferase RimO [Epsilonproteobacteria bacterium]|nr:30S ribosomal protein S12 methylthiotransferase RimO [Campylobacterota bacterium]
MNKKLHLVSLGCTKNLVDSEVMLGKLKDYEITNDPSKADVLIVNTCGFINPAKEESLDTIFELHAQRKKDSLLVVSGCLTQRYKDELQKELKEVDIFTGVGDYDKIDEIIKTKKSKFSAETYLLQNEKRVITGSKAHAYIKLSEGCNQTCSFCAIPGFKGKLKSRSIENIVNEVKRLTQEGFFDFSFISQDSSSYLRDKNEKNGLIKLIDEIENIQGVKSARILYLYPTTTDDELIDKIASSKTFHSYYEMPIQHISDKMLKIMKRGANAKRIKEQLQKMRAVKDSFIRTSLIVGHPKESEEDFLELKEFLEEFDFDRVSLFAYSDEEDTKAYEMEDKVPFDIINERIDILDEIVKQKTLKSLKKDLDKEISVITTGESSEGEFFMGARKLLWAPEIDGEILINDSEIQLHTDKAYKALITDMVGEKLLGRVTKPL